MRSVLKRIESKLNIGKETEILVKARVLRDTKANIGEVVHLIKITISPSGEITREVLIDGTKNES